MKRLNDLTPLAMSMVEAGFAEREEILIRAEDAQGHKLLIPQGADVQADAGRRVLVVTVPKGAAVKLLPGCGIEYY